MQELFFRKAPFGSSPVVSTQKEIFSRNLSFFLGFSKYILATVRSFCQNFLLIPSPCSWKVKGRLQIVLLRVTPALISCFGLLRYTADLDSIPWGDFSKRHLRPFPPNKTQMSLPPPTWVFLAHFLCANVAQQKELQQSQKCLQEKRLINEKFYGFILKKLPWGLLCVAKIRRKVEGNFRRCFPCRFFAFLIPLFPRPSYVGILFLPYGILPPS